MSGHVSVLGKGGMGIEEVRAQVHDVETKGVYWGSGNTGRKTGRKSKPGDH